MLFYASIVGQIFQHQGFIYPSKNKVLQVTYIISMNDIKSVFLRKYPPLFQFTQGTIGEMVAEIVENFSSTGLTKK